MIGVMRVRVALFSIVVVFGLFGCAAEPEPTGLAASPTASATPTVAPVDIPQPAVTLECDDALDLTGLGSILDGNPSLAEIESGDLPGYEDYPALTIALRQAGAIGCEWRVARSDGGANQFEFRVIVDAADDYQAATDPSASMEDTVRDTVGDSSALWCSPVACAFDVLVGDTWIAGSLSVLAAPPVAVESVTDLLRGLAAAVAGAPRSEDVWTTPEGAATGWGWDCQYPGPEQPVLEGLRVAFDEPGLNSQGVQVDTRYEPRRVVDALSFCPTVAGEYEVSVFASFVVGGAWAVDAPPAALGSGFVSVDVSGASAASVACSGFCTSLVAVDGSLLIVQSEMEDPRDLAPRLESVVAALRS